MKKEKHTHLEVVDFKWGAFGNDLSMDFLCLTLVGRNSEQIKVHFEPGAAFKLALGLLGQLEPDCAQFSATDFDFNSEEIGDEDVHH